MLKKLIDYPRSLLTRLFVFLSMFGKSIRIYSPIVFGSVLASLITLLTLSVNVSAQNAPDYVLGNLTLGENPTKEQTQEVVDKVTNYTNTMLKAANGNETKLSVLAIEDLAKRNIIDEDAKQGFLAYVASLPKPPMETLPGTLPGNLTIPGNTTDFLKDLDTSSALLDDIANNNSDSQVVTLMTDILKKRVTDVGTLVSGNGTDTGIVPFSDFSARGFGLGVAGAAIAMAVSPGAGSIGTAMALVNIYNAIM